MPPFGYIMPASEDVTEHPVLAAHLKCGSISLKTGCSALTWRMKGRMKPSWQACARR